VIIALIQAVLPLGCVQALHSPAVEVVLLIVLLVLRGHVLPALLKQIFSAALVMFVVQLNTGLALLVKLAILLAEPVMQLVVCLALTQLHICIMAIAGFVLPRNTGLAIDAKDAIHLVEPVIQLDVLHVHHHRHI